MGNKIRKMVSSKAFGLFALTVVLGAIVAVLNHGFLSPGNLRGMMNSIFVEGIMLACGSMLLVSGNIDLSTAGIAALTSMLFAQLVISCPGIPWGIDVIITLAFGAVLGLFNVFFMNVLNLMPFIVTIGMSSIYGGIAILWTRGNNLSINLPSFTNLGKIALFNTIPLFFILMIVIAILHGLVMSNTRFGRNVYLMGGNPNAARLVGLSLNKMRTILFVENSVVSTLAGIFWVSQKKMASASNLITAAPNMSALTAMLLGGVSFMGGSGGMVGAFMGMMLLTVFNSGLTMMKIPTYVNIAMQGVLLIVALIMDNLSARRLRKSLTAAAVKTDKEKAAA